MPRNIGRNETMRTTIFVKKAEDKKRYWASISTKTEDGYVSASIPCTLSTEAKAFMKEHAKRTTNETVRQCPCEVTDFWLKAVQGKEGNFLIMFVNKAKEPKAKDDDEDF